MALASSLGLTLLNTQSLCYTRSCVYHPVSCYVNSAHAKLSNVDSSKVLTIA